MASTDPTPKTVKNLYAMSGNRCAYPRCKNELFGGPTGHTNVSKIAHIKGESRGGPRYDPSQTDEERRDYGNLVILCGIHHDTVDDTPEIFTVEVLTKMKADHEAQATKIEDAEEINQAATFLMAHSVTVSAPNAQNSMVAGVIVNNNYVSDVQSSAVPPVYQGVLAKEGMGRFRARGEALGKSKSTHPFSEDPNVDIVLKNGPCFWFRLLPIQAPGHEWSFRELEVAAIENYHMNLKTFRGFGDYKIVARDGIGRCIAIGSSRAENVTFLFRTGEIWAVETSLFFRVGDVVHFALSEVRKHFATVIGHYSKALELLGIPTPFRWMLGIDGAEGCAVSYEAKRIGMTPFPISYKLLSGDIFKDGKYVPGDDVVAIIDEFSRAVFDDCGMEMPQDIA